MKFTKMQGSGQRLCLPGLYPGNAGGSARPGPAGVRPALRHRLGRTDLHLSLGLCRRADADVQCRRLGERDVRQRHPLRGESLPTTRGWWARPALTVETLAGIKHLELHLEHGKVSAVTVDMGGPHLGGEPGPHHPGERDYTVTPVSMGNPHAGAPMWTTRERWTCPGWAPDFEHHPSFPNRTNTEFVQVLGPDHLRMRVWGAGQRRDHGLRHRPARCWVATGAQRQVRPQRRRGPAGRPPAHPLGRGDRPRLHDRRGRHCLLRENLSRTDSQNASIFERRMLIRCAHFVRSKSAPFARGLTARVHSAPLSLLSQTNPLSWASFGFPDSHTCGLGGVFSDVHAVGKHD